MKEGWSGEKGPVREEQKSGERDHITSLTQSPWADSHLQGPCPSCWWVFVLIKTVASPPPVAGASLFRVSLQQLLSVHQTPPDRYLSLCVRVAPDLCGFHAHFLTSDLQLSPAVTPRELLLFLQLSLQFLIWVDLHSGTCSSLSTPWNALRGAATQPLAWDPHGTGF